MIRLVILVLFLIVFFILSIPVFLVEWLLGKCNMKARDKSSKWIVSHAFKVCLFISGVKIDAKGVENIPLYSPALLVPNHNSFYDILVTYTVIPTVFGFVAKKEIEKVPFLNVWMYFVRCLFIDRTNMKESLKTILKGVEQLKSGVSVCIFPEGTRSKDGKMLPFKEGSLKMAEKAGCPVIPIAIKGSSAIFENQFPRIKKGRVSIEIGKPIYANELEKEQKKFLGAYTQSVIQEMLDK